MSEIFNEGNVIGDWLKGELHDPKDFCRASVTVLAGSSLESGAVLGQISASGKYSAWDPDATDGSDEAAGILLYAVESDSDADEEKVAILARGPAQIFASKLSWIDGLSEEDKLLALNQLSDVNILTVLEA
jgi:hypothetical protein